MVAETHMLANKWLHTNMGSKSRQAKHTNCDVISRKANQMKHHTQTQALWDSSLYVQTRHCPLAQSQWNATFQSPEASRAMSLEASRMLHLDTTWYKWICIAFLISVSCRWSGNAMCNLLCVICHVRYWSCPPEDVVFSAHAGVNTPNIATWQCNAHRKCCESTIAMMSPCAD